MEKTVQANVRVAAGDRALIAGVARRLRSDCGFREQVRALLDDGDVSLMAERIKTLEQQVSWLQSGAIVVPRAGAGLPGRLRTAAAPKPAERAETLPSINVSAAARP